MKLLFMRHGKAEQTAASDAERRLTTAGVDGIQRIATVLASMTIEDVHIYASPRVRAQETAAIIAESFNVSVVTEEAVNYDFSENAVKTLTKDLSPDASVFFVGHNPSMSDVAGRISGARLDMKPGSVACVETYGHLLEMATLAWYIYPGMFKRLLQG